MLEERSITLRQGRTVSSIGKSLILFEDNFTSLKVSDDNDKFVPNLSSNLRLQSKEHVGGIDVMKL